MFGNIALQLFRFLHILGFQMFGFVQTPKQRLRPLYYATLTLTIHIIVKRSNVSSFEVWALSGPDEG